MMLTGVFRASFAHVFAPYVAQEGADPKYQITMLFPKSDLATYQAIQAEINRVLQEGVQKVFGGQMPARPELPVYDGDGVKKNGEPFSEECKGCWVVRASSKTRPSVVDLNVQPIIDPNSCYSGFYARATINFFAYNQKGNRGIGCGLNNIQKIADGEPLSGRTTAEEDFGGKNAWNGSVATGGSYLAQQSQPAYGQQTSYPAQQVQSAYGQQTSYPPSAHMGYYPATGTAPQPAQMPAAVSNPYPTGQTVQGFSGSVIDPITGQPYSGGVMGI